MYPTGLRPAGIARACVAKGGLFMTRPMHPQRGLPAIGSLSLQYRPPPGIGADPAHVAPAAASAAGTERPTYKKSQPAQRYAATVEG